MLYSPEDRFVTRLIYDRRFTYPVPHGEVTTRARVFRLKSALDVLVATELGYEENRGPWLSNTIDNCATAAVAAVKDSNAASDVLLVAHSSEQRVP